jgi:hypothetical protein
VVVVSLLFFSPFPRLGKFPSRMSRKVCTRTNGNIGISSWSCSVLFWFCFVFSKKKKKKSYAKARLILDQEDKAANRRAALVCKAHDVLFKPKAGTTGVHLKTGAEFVDVFKGVKMSTFALNDKYLYVGETGLGAKDWLSKHALHWFVVF